MKLADWLTKQGRGGAARLVRKAGVSFSAVRRAAEGVLVRREVANRISFATDAAVDPASMMKAPDGARGSEESNLEPGH